MVFAGRVYELLDITINTNCGFGTGTEQRMVSIVKNFLFSPPFPE